jgi:hypothetical protein
MWSPSADLLGTYSESSSVSVTLQYYEETAGEIDATTGSAGEPTLVYYPVRIIAQDVNPNTISITHNDIGLSASISGFYGPVYNDTVQVMLPDKTYQTFNTMTTEPIGVAVWEKIKQYNVKEVIKFIADPTRTRTFTYIVNAGLINNGVMTIRATTTKTILLQDFSWTSGRNALKAAVAKTRVK